MDKKKIFTKKNDWKGDFIDDLNDAGLWTAWAMEVDEDVYDEFMWSVPPAYMWRPHYQLERTLVLFNIVPKTVKEVMVAGEQVSWNPDMGSLYHTFIRTVEWTKAVSHYYYLWTMQLNMYHFGREEICKLLGTDIRQEQWNLIKEPWIHKEIIRWKSWADSRYWYDENLLNRWFVQWDSRQDASYFWAWINFDLLMSVTYAEGDENIVFYKGKQSMMNEIARCWLKFEMKVDVGSNRKAEDFMKRNGLNLLSKFQDEIILEQAKWLYENEKKEILDRWEEWNYWSGNDENQQLKFYRNSIKFINQALSINKLNK